jgi:UDP-N-acetylglucosamine 4-epimerase
MNYSFIGPSLERALLNSQDNLWLVTGVAGFIGSNILEFLLKNNQRVIGIDNFINGSYDNLSQVKKLISSKKWDKFKLIEGDIRDVELCKIATKNVDYVLHQAALGSVPRSIANPIETNDVNISGFLNIISASSKSGVKKFIFASSSSVYGNNTDKFKVENKVGKPLSPYAATKLCNEQYAIVFSDLYNLPTIGLRYFNVFGQRQNINGSYAAVIPKWISSYINSSDILINGQGENTRDFCHVDNVIQANILSALSPRSGFEIYNVGAGDSTSLNKLNSKIQEFFKKKSFITDSKVMHGAPRTTDILHSSASIKKISEHLGYRPCIKIDQGLDMTIDWYIAHQFG